MALNVSSIFCINLDYCPERWERMCKRLENVTPKMQRFPAVSPTDARVFQQRLAGNNLSVGALGCAFSHLDIWKRIASAPPQTGQGDSQADDQLFLILEDDVFFQNDWVTTVNTDLDFLQRRATAQTEKENPAKLPFFYMLNGAGFIDFSKNESPEREGLFSISREGGFVYYTGGYIVNHTACQKLVEKFGSIESGQKIVASDHMTKWLQGIAGGPFNSSHCFYRYPWITMQECYESFVQHDTHLNVIRDWNDDKYFPHFGHLYPEHVEKKNGHDKNVKRKKQEKRLTLVTMFYDLGRREQNSSRRQKEAYLKFGDFVLGLPYNLVIFTEPDMENYMWHRRKELCENATTLVVARPFQQLPFFDNQNLVDQMRENWKTATPVFPEKLTADYSLMCCGRPALVAEVAEWNPFQSTHFGWIDFGCDHIDGLTENFRNHGSAATGGGGAPPTFHLPENDKLWIPRKNPDDAFRAGAKFDLRFASTNLLDQVLGTFFCGTRRAVTTYSGVFSHALRHAISVEKLCPADEPLATWLNILFPSLFQCYQTDWPTLLADACLPPKVLVTEKEKENSSEGVTLKRDYEKFMTADDKADRVALRELLWKMLHTISEYQVRSSATSSESAILSPTEILRLYVEGFARLWYRFPERQQEECRALAQHHMRFLETDFRQHGVKGQHVERNRANAHSIRYNWNFLHNHQKLLDRLAAVIEKQ